jgi:hypothetical protein
MITRNGRGAAMMLSAIAAMAMGGGIADNLDYPPGSSLGRKPRSEFDDMDLAREYALIKSKACSFPASTRMKILNFVERNFEDYNQKELFGKHLLRNGRRYMVVNNTSGMFNHCVNILEWSLETELKDAKGSFWDNRREVGSVRGWLEVESNMTEEAAAEYLKEAEKFAPLSYA